jgi:uncharacterized RDD family membrane protein YckC
MPSFCPSCGTQNFDWAQTCQNCSAPLPNRPQGDPAAPQGGQPYQQPGFGPPGGYQQKGFGPPGAYQQSAFGAPPAQYASPGKRLVAVLLDGLIGIAVIIPGIILILIGAGIAGSGGRDEEAVGVIFVLLGYALLGIAGLALFLYQCYRLGRDGATLGKQWMGIKVLDASNQPLGFGKAFLRELVKSVVGNVCFILLAWPLWDAEKQGLYDKLFGTHVYEA